MKRLLTFATFVVCSLLTFAQFSGSGSGTENDPYLILNPIQLNQMRNYLNTSGVYFKLMANIDLTEFLEDENPTQGWQPVGNSSDAAFMGILDGNGKTVSGLWIKRGTSDYVGLFGYTYGAIIKNLTLTEADIIGREHVGGLCGYSRECTFSGNHFAGTILGSSYIGGLLGEGMDLTLSNNIVSATISGQNYVGGICGGSITNNYYLSYSITTCYVHSDINGVDYVGGICGNCKYTNLISCGYIGNISAETYAGGLIGQIEQSYHNTNAQCFVVGNVIANADYVGGLIGSDKSSGGHAIDDLSSSYFSGLVSGQNHVGGLVGYKKYGEISACYATGSVVGSINVGGLVGYNYRSTVKKSVAILSRVAASEENVNRIVGKNEGTIAAVGSTDENKSYNRTLVMLKGAAQDIEDSQMNGTGVSANTLKLKATYVAMGWDFTDVWAIQETECYPYMQVQTAPPVITSTLVSNATTISGKCIDGGTITMNLDGQTQQTIGTNNKFSFTVNPMQAGHTVKIVAKAEGKEQSYYTEQMVAYPGKGTEADPYLVYTADDLTGVYRKGYYKQMNDIDLTDWINANSPTEGWLGIGRDGSEMSQYDGNGFKVTGLWSNSTRDYMGLFSMFSNGTIKNLTVVTATGKKVKGGNCTGILIGRNANGVISECNVMGDVEGTSNVGGVVGLSEGCQINMLSYSGTVISSTNYANLGGIVGNSSNDQITKCLVDATINTSGTTANIGGLAGIASSAISQSQTSGNLTATGATSQSQVGGVVGTVLAGGSVTDCSSSATVRSPYAAAGIVSYNYGTVTKCFASGDIYAGKYGAGVVGSNDGTAATISKCVAVNNKIDVKDESQQSLLDGRYGMRIIGGIPNGAPAPEMDNYALKTMQVSVNDEPRTVYDDIMNGAAKEAAALKQMATYQELSWNFASTWDIDEGVAYPRLFWVANGNPVGSIALDENVVLSVGGTTTLTATVLPLSASNKQLTWSSDKESVATVVNGEVTAVAIGTANITATATDGSGVSATCHVTVMASKAEAIAELRAKVAEAQNLYDNSTEGNDIGQYTAGARATLYASIKSVNTQISNTMEDAAIAECMAEITAAIKAFNGKKVSAGEDTDITDIDNVIYVQKIETFAGSQFAISLKMKNTVGIRGFQFDVYLPEGVTAVKNNKGRIQGSLNAARLDEDDEHTLTISEQEDGSIRFLCGSQYDECFTGNNGEIATLTVKIAENIEDGDYPLILRNIKLTETDISKYYESAYLKTTLTVASYIPGDINGDKKVDVSDYIGVANHISGQTPAGFIEKAADVNADQVIDVSDYIGIANIIMTGSIYGNQNAAKMRESDDLDPQ